MNLNSSRLSESAHNKSTSEIIIMLKTIIAEHERKILELETDLKKWEKKYKEHFFKEEKPHRDHLAKIESLEHQINSFGKQMLALVDKYEHREKSHRYLIVESPLGEGLKIIEKLYLELEERVNEVSRERGQRERVIEEQKRTIEGLENQILQLKKQYGENMKKAEEYQDRLLSELKKVYWKRQ